MTNPYQQAAPESLTFAEAVRVIAERTAFRTEEDSTSVLAAIDAEIAGPDTADEDQADDEGATGEGGTPDETAVPKKTTARARK